MHQVEWVGPILREAPLEVRVIWQGRVQGWETVHLWLWRGGGLSVMGEDILECMDGCYLRMGGGHWCASDGGMNGMQCMQQFVFDGKNAQHP